MIDNNSLAGIVLGVLFFLAMFGYLIWLAYKEKRPLGEVASLKAVTNNETILMFASFITYTSESMTAANVSTGDHIMPNIFARMLLHFVISFVGWVCELTLMRDIGSLFESGLDRKSLFARCALVFLVAFFAIRVPFWNLELIAANLGQSVTYDLFIYSLLPDWWTGEMTEYYVSAGYPANYYPWGNLEPILQASIVATYVTLGLAFIAGLRNISSPDRRSILFGAKKEEEKKDESKDKKEEAKNKAEAGKPQLEKLLKFYGYEDSELQSKLEAAYTILAGITDTSKQGKIGIRSVQLVDKIAKIKDTKYSSEGAKKDAEDKLKEEIKVFFGNSHKIEDPAKAGLSTTLKSIKK